MNEQMTSAPHAIIAGFGVPGRQLADYFKRRGVPVIIIETNADTVARVARNGYQIIHGDARNPEVLLQANLPTAAALAVTMPDETVVIQCVEQARKLNPTVPIIARCAYVSGGLEASRRGASKAIIAELVVADAMTAALDEMSKSKPMKD
jgi:monovalent cation:H+ antiporter-2, CPA2 family